MSEKFLIIGANGLIGQAVSEEISSKYAWEGTYYRRPVSNYLKCDITDYENVRSVFNFVKPTHVIHCAQLAGGVDFCEENPDLAKKFHYQATINIGEQCLKYKSKFIFLSSECVFDGRKELYYENDTVNPLSVYGKWKAQSEKWLQRNIRDYIIVRTMSVYGWDPLSVTPNAVMKTYFSILKGQKVSVPIFRFGTPTYAKNLAKAIRELCVSRESGIFHVSGISFVNRYEWLKKTCDVLGWDSSFVIPRENPSADDSLRPLRIRLNTEKFQKKFNVELHSLDEGLKLLKQDMEAEKVPFLATGFKK